MNAAGTCFSEPAGWRNRSVPLLGLQIRPIVFLSKNSRIPDCCLIQGPTSNSLPYLVSPSRPAFAGEFLESDQWSNTRLFWNVFCLSFNQTSISNVQNKKYPGCQQREWRYSDAEWLLDLKCPALDSARTPSKLDFMQHAGPRGPV
jgi:hypothetical protein